jgi:polar amino acid transport system permease protein
MTEIFAPATLAFLGEALLRTLGMTLIGCSAGFAIGLALALVRRSRAGWLAPARWLAMLWVEGFRRIPFLVILMLVLFGVQGLAPGLPLIGIATLAVTLAASAYMAEIIRGGLESVPAAQVEGAEALGLSPATITRAILLPQAWRVIVPPAAAFMVMFVKDTALASHLGVVELAFAGKIMVNRGMSPVVGFGAVMLLYFALSWPLGRAARALEVRLART